MISKEKVYWFDHKPTDDNNGYIYGLQYLYYELEKHFYENFPNEVMYCEWYKTEEERDTAMEEDDENRF